MYLQPLFHAIRMVDFFAELLGPTYEITLYDLTEDPAVLAAFSGEEPSPSADLVAQHMQACLQSTKEDSCLNQNLPLPDGKTLRSSALLLREETGAPYGLLCVSFDDSAFQALNESLLKLIHPDAFIQRKQEREKPVPPSPARDTEARMRALFEEVTEPLQLPLDRLTQKERMLVIAKLQERGLFQFKGAVQHAAQKLNCSQASIYRYLSQIK